MHSHNGLSASVQNALGWYFILCVLMNLGFAWYYYRRNRTQALVWTLVAGIFLIHALAFLFHAGWHLSSGIKAAVDYAMNPVTYFFGSVLLLIIALRFRKFFTEPIVAWAILNISLLFSGWAITDNNLKDIITKPDNVPIVILIFTVGFFSWLALRQAVINDERMARGEPPMEKLEDEKVLVWPDLVYTELIAMVA